MYVIDYFDGDMAIIKNGDDSVFLDRHLLPKGAREGDVLVKHSNIEKCADEKSVAILVRSEKNGVSFGCRLYQTYEIDKNFILPNESNIVFLKIDEEESMKRREAIREFEREYDKKNHQ